MDIDYIKQVNFIYRELMVERLGNINKKQCYVDLFKCLHKNRVPYTVKDSGVLFTLNDLEQRIVYKLHEIISKYEQPDRK